jgi:CheY-like chemotaxis protein
MTHSILLADDSVTVQRVVELTFAEEGFGVISVGSGAQAIERIEQDRPDIVLADVNMPDRDGYEVAAHVKTTPHLQHIPVVLMTGAFEQIDDSRAWPAGYDGVLAKPFEPHMVIALVRDLLSRRPVEAAAGTAAAAASGERPPAEPGAALPPAAATASGFPFDPGASVASPTSSLDDYFDRLDEALAAVPPAGVRPAPAPAAAGTLAGAKPTSAPASRAAPGLSAPSPSLADAFSALLADELGESAPAVAAAAPAVTAGPPPDASAPGTAAVPLAVTDELVEAVTRRVVEQFSRQAVRDLVASTVLDVTERLVREEIERIKTGA